MDRGAWRAAVHKEHMVVHEVAEELDRTEATGHTAQQLLRLLRCSESKDVCTLQPHFGFVSYGFLRQLWLLQNQSFVSVQNVVLD